jgi:hypothetical protein
MTHLLRRHPERSRAIPLRKLYGTLRDPSADARDDEGGEAPTTAREGAWLAAFRFTSLHYGWHDYGTK